MEQPKIEFEVGQKYTNEKGNFTVVSIKEDQMIIEFEDGEQISSDVAFQLRIQERRWLEKMLQEKKKNSPAKKSGRKTPVASKLK